MDYELSRGLKCAFMDELAPLHFCQRHWKNMSRMLLPLQSGPQDEPCIWAEPDLLPAAEPLSRTQPSCRPMSGRIRGCLFKPLSSGVFCYATVCIAYHAFADCAVGRHTSPKLFWLQRTLGAQHNGGECLNQECSPPGTQ